MCQSCKVAFTSPRYSYCTLYLASLLFSPTGHPKVSKLNFTEEALTVSFMPSLLREASLQRKCCESSKLSKQQAGLHEVETPSSTQVKLISDFIVVMSLFPNENKQTKPNNLKMSKTNQPNAPEIPTTSTKQGLSVS